MAFRYDLPDVEDAYALADWIEVMMLLSKKPQISRVQLIAGFAAKTASTPQELETPINFLFDEISRRRRIADRGYPLTIEENFIKLDLTSNFEFYKFLLLISLDGPMRKGKKYKEIDEIFDKVVCMAMKTYLGEGAQAVRFGWPPSDGRPKQFRKALEWLSIQIGLPVGSGIPAPDAKDGGVDVVAWKPFADNRSAFVVAFGQCTVQTNWFPKGKDVVDNIWASRIDAGGRALTSLAVPFIIPKNYPKWDDLRRMVGIVFDRIRLAQMLGGCDIVSFSKMTNWSKKEISKFSMAV